MKRKKHLFIRFRAFILLCIAPIFAACGTLPSYNYESIRTEYAGRVCTVAPNPAPGASQASAECTVTSPLALSRAIEIATQNNPDLMQAEWRIEQARAMLAVSQAAFWPQISFYTEYMQGDAPSGYLFKKIDQRLLPPLVDFNDPGWFQNFETGLKGRLNLFNGFNDVLGVRIAETGIDISRSNRVQILNDLTAAVITAYYDALAAGEFIRIAESSVETVAEQLRIMRIRYEGGAVVKSDVLSLEVRLAQAREQLVSSRNRYQLALAALANLMGLDPNALSEKNVKLKPSEIHKPDIPSDHEAGLLLALERRPELAQARQQVVKSRMQLSAARGSFLPRLDLATQYYVDDPHLEYDLDRENWTAALVLNWDLFTGFSRPARVRQAEAQVKQMLTADRKATLAVKLDVKNAYLNLQEAASRFKVAKSSVENAEESFRLVKEHYLGGAVPITRYLEVELDRNRAHIRSTAAYYDQIKARAEVARAVGFWTPQQP